MRIWDIPAGYLNRGSLLGEHRELHGLLSVLREGKGGYSRHPETLRWVGCESGLARRHALLVAEMSLRSYADRTPVEDGPGEPVWPEECVDPPAAQFELLAEKYAQKEPGRIPLPLNPAELWAQHKYSVLARDPEAYRELGRRVAAGSGGRSGPADPPSEGIEALADDLLDILRRRPPAGRLRNAIDHMWGHVEEEASRAERKEAAQGAAPRLAVVQRLALRTGEPYLTASTALSELAVFVD